MSLDRIDQFELSNKLAVNVYEVENNERVVPLRASVITNPRDTIDLLFVEQGEKNIIVWLGTYQSCWNMPAMIRLSLNYRRR